VSAILLETDVRLGALLVLVLLLLPLFLVCCTLGGCVRCWCCFC
jgi:hypothetical protein